MAKAAYIGIPTAFPVYKEETKTIAITAANVAQYFTVRTAPIILLVLAMCSPATTGA